MAGPRIFDLCSLGLLDTIVVSCGVLHNARLRGTVLAAISLFPCSHIIFASFIHSFRTKIPMDATNQPNNHFVCLCVCVTTSTTLQPHGMLHLQPHVVPVPRSAGDAGRRLRNDFPAGTRHGSHPAQHEGGTPSQALWRLQDVRRKHFLPVHRGRRHRSLRDRRARRRREPGSGRHGADPWIRLGHHAEQGRRRKGARKTRRDRAEGTKTERSSVDELRKRKVDSTRQQQRRDDNV
jgi:hypothetical protein